MKRNDLCHCGAEGSAPGVKQVDSLARRGSGCRVPPVALGGGQVQTLGSSGP